MFYKCSVKRIFLICLCNECSKNMVNKFYIILYNWWINYIDWTTLFTTFIWCFSYIPYEAQQILITIPTGLGQPSEYSIHNQLSTNMKKKVQNLLIWNKRLSFVCREEIYFTQSSEADILVDKQICKITFFN